MSEDNTGKSPSIRVAPNGPLVVKNLPSLGPAFTLGIAILRYRVRQLSQ